MKSPRMLWKSRIDEVEASGVPYGELLERLIALALERHERKSTLRY